MRISEQIFHDSIKPSLASIIAEAYKKASLTGEPMIDFAIFMEHLKANLSQVNHLASCLDLLDDCLAIAYTKSWTNASPHDFRNTLLKSIQDAYADIIKQAQKEDAHQGYRILIALFLEWVFTWRLFHAKAFVTQHEEYLSNRPDEVPDLSYYAQLMDWRRWVEVMPMATALIESPLTETYDKARLHAMLADIELHWIGNKAKAKAHIATAMGLNPNIGYAYDIRARITQDEGNNEAALLQFNGYKEKFPADIQPHVSLGIYYEKTGEPARAIQQYDEILLRHQGHTPTLYQKLQLANLINSDIRACQKFIEETTGFMLYIEPEAAYDVRIAAASAYDKVEDYNLAETAFKQAIEIDPKRPEGYNLFGVMRAKQIRATEEEANKASFLEEAVSLHENSIRLAPGHFDGYWSLVLLYQQVRDYPKAIEVLQQALSNCSAFERLIYMQQVYLYQDLQNWEGANTALLHAIGNKQVNDSIDGFIEEAVTFYKNALVEQQQYKEALGLLKKFIDDLAYADGEPDRELWQRLRIDAMISFDKTSPELLGMLNEAVRLFPNTQYFHEELIKLLSDNPSFEKEKADAVELGYEMFPNVAFFKDQIKNHVFGFTHEYIAAPRPIYIDFDDAISHLILKPGTNEFVPEFMETLEAFRQRMKDVYGLHIPGMQFRTYYGTNQDYDYYLTIDEVIVVAGKKIRQDAILVRGVGEGAEAEGIPAHDLMENLYWDLPSLADAFNANGVDFFKPEQLIFFQLEFFIWQHAARFIKADDEDIRKVLESEDYSTAAKFMELLQILVSGRVPILNKDSLLLRMKLGLQRGHSITHIASEIMIDKNYQPLQPAWLKSKSVFKISDSIQHTLTQSMDTLASGEWYLKIIPQDCQEILAAIRYVEPVGNEKVLLGDDQTAWALSTMAKLEFPYLQLVTAQYPDVPEMDKLVEITTD
jgi:tetratricopeptide (TPR) repeat protein